MELLLHRLSRPQETSARLLEIFSGAAANLCTVNAGARDDLLGRAEAPAILRTLLLTTQDSSTIFELLRLLTALAHRAASSVTDGQGDAST